jgi:heat shock protein HslJ
MRKQLSLTVLACLIIGAGLPLTTVAAQAGDTLANTHWVLTQYAVQRSAFAPAVGEQHPTLTFGPDGRISGNAGCNLYSGPYSQAGDELSIGPVAATLRACLDQDVADQEQLMFRVLSGTVLSIRDGNKLTLSAPAGALIFAASDSVPTEPGAPGMPRTGDSHSGWPLLLLALALGVVGLGIRLRRAASAR